MRSAHSHPSASTGPWLLIVLACLSLGISGCPAKTPPAAPPVTTPAGAQSPDPPADPPGEYGHERLPVDPVALNGPIFEGWPAPKWALVVTGEQDGYLEPCGCAGRENQKGGLMRRFSLLAQLRSQAWPLVPLDLGGLIRRFGPQSEIKFQQTVSALTQMQYEAAGLGIADLRLPGDVLLSSSASAADGQSLFVAANWRLTLDETFTTPFRVVTQNGVRLGVTAVLGDQYVGQLAVGDIVARPAHEALTEIAPQLVAQSDQQILLAYATPAESLELARRFPDFDVVVTAGGAEEPPREPAHIEGQSTLIVEVGHKGMYAAVLAGYDDPDQPWRFQRVPLDSRFPDAPEMKQLLADYQQQLRLSGLEALVGTPLTHPRHAAEFERSGHFAGAGRCGECHKQAFAKWQATPHAHATESLVKLDPPRQFDPECLSCHVTGWHPQDYLPYESGFVSLSQTPLLAGNSCENCHGPGEEHALIEERKSARTLARRDQLRAALRLTKATAGTQVCLECHDHDNSPEFDFEKYWPKVEHRGKD